jgi:dTMP kinase
VAVTRDPLDQQRARLVCFCGIDGSGKSTQLRMAQRWLATAGHRTHRSVLLTRKGEFFKTLEPVMDMIPAQLMSDLFAFERYRVAQHRTRAAIEAGDLDFLLCDRYLYTDWAYTIADGCDPAVARTLISQAPQPDLVLIFDVPVDLALQRIHARDKEPWERQENAQFLTRARDAYLELATECGFPVIDGSGDPDAIHSAVRQQLHSLLA